MTAAIANATNVVARRDCTRSKALKDVRWVARLRPSVDRQTPPRQLGVTRRALARRALRARRVAHGGGPNNATQTRTPRPKACLPRPLSLKLHPVATGSCQCEPH